MYIWVSVSFILSCNKSLVHTRDFCTINIVPIHPIPTIATTSIVLIIGKKEGLENARNPSGNIFMFMDYIVIFTPRPFISLWLMGTFQVSDVCYFTKIVPFVATASLIKTHTFFLECMKCSLLLCYG